MIPRKLVIKNFLSHIESSIDFSKFNAALILGAYNNNPDESNGSGKSALLESIRWVLFDKARHKKKDSIVKRDAKSCTVQLEFSADNKIYRITRTRDKVVGESNVNLEQWTGAEFNVIECDTNTATDAKIAQIIGFNHEIFTNSVYFKQGDISLFTKSTPSKRKDILKALLKLERWDAYQRETKKLATKLNIKIEEKSNNLVDIGELEKDIKTHNEHIHTLKNQISGCNKEFTKISNDLSQRKHELQSIPADANRQLSQLNKESAQAKKRIKDIGTETIGNNDKIKKLNTSIAKNDQELKVLNVMIKGKNGINLESARNGLMKGHSKAKYMKEKINNLQKGISIDECNSCLRPINKKEIVIIKNLREDRLIVLKQDYSSLTQKIKKSENKFKDLEGTVFKGNDAEIKKSRAGAKITVSRRDLQSHMKLGKSLSDELANLTSRDFEKEIKTLRDRYGKKRLEYLKEDVMSLEKSSKKTKNSLDKLNVEFGSKNNSKQELVKKKNEQIIVQKELNKLNEDYRVYDRLKHLFGKDGVQSIIIENVIDELENYTNNTLSKICNEPTSISIKMQKQSEMGSWTETFDIEVNIGSRQEDFEALSGGEQFRISLALRLALSKILSKRMGGEVKFLLLDEVSSALDESGLALFANIIKQLSNDMKIMIITHDNKLKDHFDDIIMVEKDHNGSRAHI